MNRGEAKIPISPCQKGGEIGVQIVATEDVRGKREVVQEEDAAVPQMWVALAQLGKMRIDLQAALLRERPRPLGKNATLDARNQSPASAS
jgi:hypothetical protein